MSFFKLIHAEKHTRARAGIIHTDHGDIETPAFMPVGTQASVKTLDQNDLEALGAQIILGNTYHLHLRPGEDTVAELGGLHNFMNWNRPILTDSGGFQVFSLGTEKHRNNNNCHSERASRRVEGSIDHIAPVGMTSKEKLVKIDEDGVTFRSHLDGSTHRFTPESSIEIQHKLGADIIMAFDECTPDDADIKYTKEAMERTHRWAVRSLEEHKRLVSSREATQRSDEGSPRTRLALPYNGIPRSVDLPRDDKIFLFGIIQGANHRDLREESARYISVMDFDGIAIGGESIGYNMEATKQILDWVIPLIPKDKPHYAMGLGLSPLDLFEVVERGVDMFDCVAPTRLARHGMLYIKSAKDKFRLDITNAKFSKSREPIDPVCTCPTCLPRRSSKGAKAGRNYTRAYLHHLFRANELSAFRLATIHNVHFFLDLMRKMREAIKEDGFMELKKEWST